MLLVVLSLCLVLPTAFVLCYPLVFEIVRPLHDDWVPPFDEQDRLLEALSELKQSKAAGMLSDQDYEAEFSRLEQAYLAAKKSASQLPPNR